MSKIFKRIVITLLGITVFSLSIHLGQLSYSYYKDADSALIKELKNSALMQRLKGVDQHGMAFYFLNIKPFSRYDHCVGVYELLKKAHASEAEQIAGFLHDASHTAFSHTADYLFAAQGNFHENDSYQDSVHLSYLAHAGITPILSHYGYTLESIDPHNKAFTALEQELPDMCADRIDYNIRAAGLTFDKITQKEADFIYNNLSYKDGKWFFTDAQAALIFAELSLFYTEDFLNSGLNDVMNIWGAELLQRAVDLGIISYDDIHYGQDLPILERIKASQDKKIKVLLEKLKNPYDYFIDQKEAKNKKIKARTSVTKKITKKFRGVDPLVKGPSGEFKRLTDLNPAFKKEYDRVKAKSAEGNTLLLFERKMS